MRKSANPKRTPNQRVREKETEKGERQKAEVGEKEKRGCKTAKECPKREKGENQK